MDTNTLRACTFLDKGGVGKTTATAHLSVPISEDYQTLLVDLAGKQNDLAKQFGCFDEVEANADDWPNVSTVFSEEWDSIAEKVPDATAEMILETDEGPDLLPHTRGLIKLMTISPVSLLSVATHSSITSSPSTLSHSGMT